MSTAQSEPNPNTNTRRQPPYAIIVINDDVHTFDYVIACFQKVFRYNKEKAKALALKIHESGKAVVWTGVLEVAELYVEMIKEMGPDDKGKCDFPLSVELKPMR